MTIIARIALITVLTMTVASAQHIPRNVVFIVDGSGSMAGRIENQTKIEIARSVVAERIQALAPDISIGLVAYGHRWKNDCNDIQTLVGLGSGSRDTLLASLDTIKPKEGKTPIATAIERAVNEIATFEGTSTIILMSDGKENCKADPCETVKRLRQQTAFSLHVVGFGVAKANDVRQLQCIAEAGGGDYYTAATAKSLDAAFKAVAKRVDAAAAPGTIQENIELVLDTSAAMRNPFDGTTRLAAATDALDKVLALQSDDRDNLAFRRFGGSCDGDNTELVLDFALNRATSIKNALSGLTTAGESTLVDAANAAIFDFDPPSAFANVSKRIVIIAGGHDPCFAHIEAASLIRQRLQTRNINPEFRFIGIDLPPDRAQQLSRIVAATNGELSIVRTRAELDDALAKVLEVEPAMQSIDGIKTNFNQLVDRIDAAIERIEQQQYEQAEAEIQRSWRTTQGAELPLRDLGGRTSDDGYVTVFGSASQLRVVQSNMLKQLEDMLMHRRDGNQDAFNDSARAYNELVKKYSQLANSTGEIISRLRAR